MTILETAAQEISYRNKVYDTTQNLRRIAVIWGQVLGIPVSVDQVCLCMAGLKLSRLVGDPRHTDSQMDLCGYVALMERMQKGGEA